MDLKIIGESKGWKNPRVAEMIVEVGVSAPEPPTFMSTLWYLLAFLRNQQNQSIFKEKFYFTFKNIFRL